MMLLALIMLTQLDGNPIWVEHSMVHIIKPHETGRHPTCPHNTGTAITVGPRGLCLKETVDQVCDKVEKFGGKCDR